MKHKIKPISVRIKDTDLEMMKKFVELTDRMGLYKDWYSEGDTDEQHILKWMRSFCNEVSWFNRDKNPYVTKVKK